MRRPRLGDRARDAVARFVPKPDTTRLDDCGGLPSLLSSSATPPRSTSTRAAPTPSPPHAGSALTSSTASQGEQPLTLDSPHRRRLHGDVRAALRVRG